MEKLGGTITKQDWQRMVGKQCPTKEEAEVLEAFIREVLQAYTKKVLQSTSAQARVREVNAFVVRCGEAYLKYSRELERCVGHGGSTHPEFPRVQLERQLRQGLRLTQSCPPAATVAEAVEFVAEAAEPEAKKARAIADTAGRLDINEEGFVNMDYRVAARALGLVPGARVETTKNLRGVLRGAIGVIAQVENPDILVQFDKGSLQDGSDTQQEHVPVFMTRGSLCVYAPLKKRPRQKRQRRKLLQRHQSCQMGSPGWVAKTTWSRRRCQKCTTLFCTNCTWRSCPPQTQCGSWRGGRGGPSRLATWQRTP